jgi:hypothetical protein
MMDYENTVKVIHLSANKIERLMLDCSAYMDIRRIDKSHDCILEIREILNKLEELYP